MTPKGFWSYARGDDAHLDSLLTKLRGRIAGEISMLLGREIDMFQDIYDIRTGDDWEAKLKAEITAASFMTPVLTPRYFERPWCREELLTFLRLADEAGHAPLIFPIYFVADRKYDRGEHCEVREAVSKYQFFDYRPLRFESDPTKLDRAVHEFASDVVDRLEALEAGVPREAVVVKPKPAPKLEPLVVPEGLKSELTSPLLSATPSLTPELPTLTVDPWPGRGDFETIGEAILASERGGRVVIRPGTYDEKLTLDKPLELIGDGAREDVVVSVSKGEAMVATATIARVQNMTFRCNAVDGIFGGISVTGGKAAFSDCVFSSQSGSAVYVYGSDAAPKFARCLFHGSGQCGAVVYDYSRPVFEDCEMIDNDFHGVEIFQGADPVLRRCVLRGNKHSAIFVYIDGRGLFEGCTVSENGRNGIASFSGGKPDVRNCTISNNGHWGVRTGGADSGGRFEGNVFSGNKDGAWNLAEGSEKNVIWRDNREE